MIVFVCGFISLLLSQLVVGHPAWLEGKDAGSVCPKPRVRKEWRSLSVPERKRFTSSVKCLMAAPPKFKKYFPIVGNRYDDFVALHVNMTLGGHKLENFLGFGPVLPGQGQEIMSGVHSTGAIMPWHRYAISLWEEALISECGWQDGGVPYWNWYLDTKEGGGSFHDSPLFDAESGFGGNGKKLSFPARPGQPKSDQSGPKTADSGHGHSESPIEALLAGFSTGGGCIIDGPFVNHTLRIGPLGKMAPNNTRCLKRSFNKQIAEASVNKKTLSWILSAKTYAEFNDRMNHAPPFPANFTLKDIFSLPGDLHSIGHGGVGGEMMDPFNSPNDPLFFMHHGAMDHFWALWQEQDYQKRLYDFSASKGEKQPLSPDSPLGMGEFAPAKVAKQVSDTQNRDGNGILCYKYEGLPIEKYML